MYMSNLLKVFSWCWGHLMVHVSAFFCRILLAFFHNAICMFRRYINKYYHCYNYCYCYYCYCYYQEALFWDLSLGYKKIVFCSQKLLIWYVYSFIIVPLKFCENTLCKASVRMDWLLRSHNKYYQRMKTWKQTFIWYHNWKFSV